jgi:hypothetical protein
MQNRIANGQTLGRPKLTSCKPDITRALQIVSTTPTALDIKPELHWYKEPSGSGSNNTKAMIAQNSPDISFRMVVAITAPTVLS